jgi:CubicO group peptidase (beta-lactamase class C family)
MGKVRSVHVHTPHGYVAEGFEHVTETFARSAEEVGSGGAAFAAVVDGTLVVDLWAGTVAKRPWMAATRGVLMSTTKGIATVVVAQLVDQGLLDVDAAIADYWPEFAQAGKERVTVAQVLAHTSGLTTVPDYADLLEPTGRGWDRTHDILERLARASPRWAPGSDVGYHGLTFSWLVGELVRRVSGETLGTLFRENVAGPLALEIDIGTPAHLHGLVATPLLPEVDDAESSTDASSEFAAMIFDVDGRNLITCADQFFASPRVLEMELPASNGTGTARSVATLYSALVDRRPESRQLISPVTLERFTTEVISGTDRVLSTPVRRGLGFELADQSHPPEPPFTFGPHREAFGHGGHGGQLGFADPAAGLGIGFVRSHLSLRSPLGPRLVDAVYAELE